MLSIALPTTAANRALADTGAGASKLPASSTSTAANKDTFLKLLVAQLQNQSPLNPTDGTQFVAQLAQFSQLEQTITMREDLDAVREALATIKQPSIAGSDRSTPIPGGTK